MLGLRKTISLCISILTSRVDDFWVGDYLLAYGADAELSYTMDLPHLTREGSALSLLIWSGRLSAIPVRLLRIRFQLS